MIVFYFAAGLLVGIGLHRWGALIFDKFIGRISLEIHPDNETRYHGYYVATERGGNAEEFNIFALSLKLNNQSTKPVTIVDYSVDLQFPNGGWHRLEKHEAKDVPQRFQEHKRINEFYNRPLAPDAAVAVLVTTYLPLKVLRLHEGAKEMKYRIRLKERRGITVEKTLILRQVQQTRLSGLMRPAEAGA